MNFIMPKTGYRAASYTRLSREDEGTAATALDDIFGNKEQPPQPDNLIYLQKAVLPTHRNQNRSHNDCGF